VIVYGADAVHGLRNTLCELPFCERVHLAGERRHPLIDLDIDLASVGRGVIEECIADIML
jgi:hypothetical protein